MQDLELLFRRLERDSAEGSTDALEELLERCGTSLLHFFANQGVRSPEREDLAQETLLRVYKGIGSFRGASKFKTWFFKIARHQSLNARRNRHAKKRAGHEIPVDEAFGVDGEGTGESHEPMEPNADTLGDMLAQEQIELLKKHLEELTPQRRRCVEMHYFQDMPIKTIAKVLKIAPSTVKYHLDQGRQHLRSLVGDTPGDLRGPSP